MGGGKEMLERLGGGEPSDVLRAWLMQHSDVLRNPWADPEYEDKQLELPEKLNIIDPVHGQDKDFETCTRRHGGGSLYTWSNGDTFTGHMEDGLRQGWGVLASAESDITMLSGEWEAGALQGHCRLVRGDTEVTEAWVRSGCLHGLARKTIMKKWRTFAQHVSWLGRYRGGVAWGQCWAWQEGGGYITGEVDTDTGAFTGDNIAFLYPDMLTAIVGRFNNGVLVDGVSAILADVRVRNSIAEPTWSLVVSPGPEQRLRFCRSTESSVGAGPLVPDPYEERTVEVRTSGVGGGGEGLYVKRNIAKGELIALYNGIRISPKHGRTLKESWDNSGYKIFTNTNEVWGERLDLPGDLIYLENYRATLAHKINHNFHYNCTEWFFQHPRHGLIPSIIATSDIEKGYDPRNCPDWYREELDRFMAENPELELEEAADPKRLEKLEKPSWKQQTSC